MATVTVASAEAAREEVMGLKWTEEHHGPLNRARAIVKAYRSQYKGEQDETYRAVEELHKTVEACTITDHMSEAISKIVRDVVDTTGYLGTNTKHHTVNSENIERALSEYSGFLQTLGQGPIAAKVQTELGQKLVHLRQTTHIPDFAAKFSPIACDHMVVDKK
eukprot:CAMPEP_0198352560 /NCGR_PEP_ID=MMETSP1450-20131203/107679_1 /TAXON_ID=753684 ORGANISM="Madagascaria erythrocladiodes, Strain CCMP3234" /NCGR_SAMPLE_ID=MMETSP1450 /ASSEMBLY_ACC=CAM_ASM_001115 /LENGTH=162 /DNA_ID=CAMNT_0044058597 /DNA_START=44 /DNA_END=532 /DNA_ORIENTATION=-